MRAFLAEREIFISFMRDISTVQKKKKKKGETLHKHYIFCMGHMRH